MKTWIAFVVAFVVVAQAGTSIVVSQPRAQVPSYDASREGDIVHLKDAKHEITVSVATSLFTRPSPFERLAREI